MRSRPTIWILLCLLFLAGAWLFWPHAARRVAQSNSPAQKNSSVTPVAIAPATAPKNSTPLFSPLLARTNEFVYRLSNTTRSIGELKGDRRAILLENALIDTRRPLNFSIPKNLQSAGDPAAYIVQANGLNNAAFRALLTAAGAQIISYIPNNAYLVRVSADGAASLMRNAQPVSVIPYEPYYKILNSSLLGAAVRQNDLPEGTPLTLGLFADNAAETVAQIEKMGGKILATDHSPFGPMVRVAPPQNWTALADLPGVQIMEPYHARIHANDLSRATTGVAVNSTAPTNYLNLYGSNVLVAVADTGVDATHPDLLGRVFGSSEVLVDTNSHGTFIAGEIAGSGLESTTVTNAEGSVNPGTNYQYRGKAPLAKVFIMSSETNSDLTLQQGAAISNALIANESWNLDGDTLYDLEAASYDAATRDSVAGASGSQSVLYVFPAGNDGGGGNNGIDGTQGSVLSPATAKDVVAVGATEEQRNITNYVTAANGTSNQVWLPETDTSFEVASFSARGNVGVGTEGTKGRYKPDVVAPGTFTISTRSQQWDQKAYYFQSSTNFQDFTYQNQTVGTNSDFNLYSISVPANAIGVVILIEQSSNSFLPSNMPIYVQQSDYPDPVNDPADIDFITHNDMVSIPPDSGGNIAGLQSILGDGFFFAIGNSTNVPITYNVLTEIITTNNLGDGQIVLSNLNNSIGPWYRYESGTSMAAGDVSGTLALIQDYFTNTLHTLPSPALLKALLINGARAVGNYNFNQADSKNYQGWGLINLPNSVPAGSTNPVVGSNSVFYLDQSPTNALATGDSHTFIVNISSNSTALPFRVTAAWTDPPGNPAAAIKLVNNLDLIVSNMATNIVYYGNDIPVSSIYNEVGSTNAPNLDIINNIENVFLPPLFAGTYSVTVVGRGVNVNAVTAQSNNIVQDYALVISSGGGLTPGSITVTDLGNVSKPTSDQLITGVTATNAPMFNQFVGANSPLLGTNTVAGGGAGTAYATNSLVTVGMTNQWHFYIVTNTGANNNFTNAAFVTFLPPTLSIPREGVFADSDANSTTPEADIDLYVASLQSDVNAASLTNLNPTVISNCVHGLSGDNASLSRGGTEFVVYTNSAPGQIYYVGVKSETQMASEYAFLPVFTQTPFSQTDSNGNEIVNGIPLPTAIPDGSPAHPGAGYVFGLALQPMQIQNVTVSNQITHQNIGDLIGVLAHDAQTDVLNNHYSTNSPPAPGPYDFLYDDSQNPVAGSQPSAGKGLGKFVGQQAVGAWQLTEVDDSQGQTGSVTGFSLLITPHIDPTKQPVTVTLQPGQFYTTYVDVPVGATNLTIFATNITSSAALNVQLFVRYGTPPTLSNYDATTTLSMPSPLGPSGFISISATNSPPIRSGRYFFSLFNPSSNPPQTVTYFATIGIPLTGPTPLDFHPDSGPVTLSDDAVTTSTISVPNSDPISAINVGIRVDHPRISDLAFHLISPDGSRYSLMENRGATTTNGAGASYFTTNTTDVPHNGNADAYTNVINTGTTNGTITINYDFFAIPDTMEIFDGANLLTNTGLINGSATFSINYSGSPIVTIIMNPGGNTNNPTTAWTYSVTSTTAKYTYLTFVEDTNLTTTPIKFAPTPFTPIPSIPTNLFVDSFETNAAGVYTNSQKVGDFNEFTVTSNSVTVVSDPTTAASGSNYLALGTGAISTILPTVVGQPYIFQYSYRGADLSIVGGVQEISVAASTNWQTHYVRFTAAQTGTPVTIQGTGPGALLDNVTFTELPPTLYFLPEQSLDPLVGLPANGQNGSGQWQLEVQDNRVGAYDSNSPPVLQDWQLEFVLANTNALKPPIFTNTPADTNMNELTTLVITNGAVAATNTLTLTYSLVNPPADGWITINPSNGIITLFPQEVDGPTNWTVITMVTDNGSPSLSSVNSFNVTVNEVNTPPFWPPNVPSQTNYTILDLNTLIVTNTAMDTDSPPNTLTYRFLSPPTPTNAVIDVNTGIISWTPTLAQTNATPYTFTTVVTDTNLYALTNQSLSATNSFTVTVLPPLSLTNDVPSTNSIGIGAGGILWYLVRVPTNADIATNLLLFADAPLNIWFSTNSPPTITTTNDYGLIPNATNGSSILNTTSTPTNIVTGGFYYLGVQNPNSFTVTNYALEVDFHLVIPGIPFSATLPAKAMTGTNALLNGFATPSGLPATAWFQWGFTTNYGALTPPVPVGLGFGVVYVSNSISSLIPGQTYHYRLVTSNSVAVANGFDQIFGEGNVVAWGADTAGQTNIPAGLSNVVAVAGGGFFSLGLKNDGTVAAWGDGVSGDTNVPVGLSNVVEIAAGAFHGVALKSDGTVVVWGETTYGDTNVPAGLSNVVMVAAGSGGHHTLALKSNGTVVSWGEDIYGQTNIPAGLTNIVMVAGGGEHSLALQNNGSVVAWGAGLTNNPGDGIDFGQSIVPAGLTNAVAVAGGELHSLALKNDETVIAWGAGTNNTGINPNYGQSIVPAGLTNAVVVSGGEFHSLALKNDGTMIAWGDDTSGQTNIPASFTNVVGISAGAYHNLALTSRLFNAPINYAPFWPSNPPPQTVNELSLLTVTNTATDTNVPPDALTYTVSISVNYALMLTNLWPTNFAGTNPPPIINPTNGIITWTPSETQGPGVYTITTIVTDTNVFATTNQSLSATNSFTVTVNETNSAPFWTTNPPPQTVNELTLLTVTNTATDTDVPSNTLTYTVSISVSNSATLNNGWPTNFVGTNPPPIINPTNGIIIWTPSETQGPGVYTITTIVTDTNLYALTNKSLSATNNFSVTVNEVNTAPFFTNNLTTNIVATLTTLTVTNTAIDTDSPPNTLSYRLLNPPAGSSFDTNGAIFTWTPPAIFANTTNIFTNIVTDYNPYDPVIARQHLSATNLFVVIVFPPPYAATLAATAVTGTNAQLSGFATPNGMLAFAWFEWGTNNSYGNRTTNVTVGSGQNVVYVTNQLTGLLLPQPYHFRLVTSNSLAVTYGFDQIFDVGGITVWGDTSSGLTNIPPILTNTAAAISAGSFDSLALRNNGRPIAWGDNSSTQTNVPASLTNAVAVGSGYTFNLALRNNGRVVGWGDNSFGQTNVPAGLSNVVAIAAGQFHGLALRTNGTLFVWGNIGSGITNIPAGLSNVVAIAAGALHSLAVKNDGTVVAWGVNASGQTNVPAGLKNVVAVAGGDNFSLALKTNGTVVAWGDNSVGETNVPAGLSNVVAIAAGNQHCLALKRDGTVVAWGDDTFGQTDVPPTLSSVAAIAGGGYHSLALVAATPVNQPNNHPPIFVILNPTNHFINVGAVLSVTNTATDPDAGQILIYALLNPPANATINSANGIITFTPVVAQAGTTNAIVTTVTDNGAPPLSATNSFFVFVNPYPAIGGVTFTTNALTLTWTAWTNEQFQVQWKTNLAPVIPWNTFPPIITSTTGNFSFTDTNAPFLTKFYRLILLP